MTQQELFKVTEVTPVSNDMKDMKPIDVIIDKEFIMRDDLRDWIFREDSNGSRYRERIFEKIQEFGVENWFKARGFPTNPESIWKNRYGGTEKTLIMEVHHLLFEQGWNAIILWENYLPIEIWNDKNLHRDCKVGTSEYYKRVREEELNKKKYEKADKKKYLDTIKSVLTKEEFNEEAKKEERTFGQRIYDKQQEFLKEDLRKKDWIEEGMKKELAIITEKKENVNKENNTLRQQQVFPKPIETCACGKPLFWDCCNRNLCLDCLKGHYNGLFMKNGLGKEGFKELNGVYTFFSHTTGITIAKKEEILGCGNAIMGNEIFPYVIYLCNEWGLHKDTLGITKEFFEHLVKELNLVKTIEGDKQAIEMNGEEFHTKWKNPLIKQDKEGKERAELDKKIQEKSSELRELLIKKMGFKKNAL